jgi:hypothetical protein
MAEIGPCFGFLLCPISDSRLSEFRIIIRRSTYCHRRNFCDTGVRDESIQFDPLAMLRHERARIGLLVLQFAVAEAAEPVKGDRTLGAAARLAFFNSAVIVRRNAGALYCR